MAKKQSKPFSTEFDAGKFQLALSTKIDPLLLATVIKCFTILNTPVNYRSEVLRNCVVMTEKMVTGITKQESVKSYFVAYQIIQSSELFKDDANQLNELRDLAVQEIAHDHEFTLEQAYEIVSVASSLPKNFHKE